MACAGEPDAAATLRIAVGFVDVVFRSRRSDRGLAMFQRLIDDFKESTGSALRLTSLAAAAAMALLVTTAFLCAAAFVFVLEQYGPVQACLTGAAIFFVVTMIAAICYMVRRNQIRVRAEQAAKSAAHTMLADPMLVAARTMSAAKRRRSSHAVVPALSRDDEDNFPTRFSSDHSSHSLRHCEPTG